MNIANNYMNELSQNHYKYNIFDTDANVIIWSFTAGLSQKDQL